MLEKIKIIFTKSINNIRNQSQAEYLKTLSFLLYSFLFSSTVFILYDANRIKRHSVNEPGQISLYLDFIVGSFKLLFLNYAIIIGPLFIFIILLTILKNKNKINITLLILFYLLLHFIVIRNYWVEKASSLAYTAKFVLIIIILLFSIFNVFLIFWHFKKIKNKFILIFLLGSGFFLLSQINRLYYRLYPDFHIYLNIISFYTLTLIIFLILFSILYKIEKIHFLLSPFLIFLFISFWVFSLSYPLGNNFRYYQYLYGRYSVPFIQLLNKNYKKDICNNKEKYLKDIKDFQLNLDVNNFIKPGPDYINAHPYNFLFISIDALRADKLNNKYTKYLNTLKEKSIYFENFFAPSSGTIGTMFGIWGLGNPSFIKSIMSTESVAMGKIADSQFTFVKELQMQDYTTAAFISRTSMQHVSVNSNLLSNFDWVVYGSSKEDKSLITPVRQYLKATILNNNNRHFIWLHISEPHEPYKDKRFGISLIDKYHGDIALADEILESIIKDYLVRLRKNTIIFIGSDHGEEFKDHGGNYHRNTVFNEVLKVPGILFWPNLPPKKIKINFSMLELFQIILNNLSLQKIEKKIPIGYKILKKNFPNTIFSEINASHSLQVGLIFNQYKLIYDYYQNIYFLFDLKNDPKEKRNLYSTGNVTIAENKMLKRLNTYRNVRACFQEMHY